MGSPAHPSHQQCAHTWAQSGGCFLQALVQLLSTEEEAREEPDALLRLLLEAGGWPSVFSALLRARSFPERVDALCCPAYWGASPLTP